MSPGHKKDRHDPPPGVGTKARLGAASAVELVPRDPLLEATPRSAEKLLHQLQAPRIELEMQKESLRQSQADLEESRDRYLDFYDCSPVGYLTLSDKGLIVEINLTGATMLGTDRTKLVQRSLSRSIAEEDQDRWHRHFMNALQLDAHLNCEVTLQRPDGTHLEVRLDSLRLTRDGKAPKLRLVLTDITEQEQAREELIEMAASLESQVVERTKQLRQLSAQLTLTEERERRLLAQELHDNLGQLLAVIKIKLTSLVVGSLDASIHQIVELVDNAEQSARAITLELSPPILHALGLVAALEWLADEMAKVYGIRVHFDVERAPKPLVSEIQAMLYRSVRELLINVARHAHATDADLYCRCDGNRLTLVVSDEGCGFDPTGLEDGWPGQGAFGLNSIRERVTNIGGKMEIDSSPGKGTSVTLTVPCSIAAKEDQS